MNDRLQRSFEAEDAARAQARAERAAVEAEAQRIRDKLAADMEIKLREQFPDVSVTWTAE